MQHVQARSAFRRPGPTRRDNLTGGRHRGVPRQDEPQQHLGFGVEAVGRVGIVDDLRADGDLLVALRSITCVHVFEHRL
eukprot:9500605-Pyramimonas_sp.AAC.1